MLLTCSSALGKLGKIKTFTVKGLINFFSDRLSSCNYSHLKMRLQTRTSWLTLKFCFWLFLNKLQEWMWRSQASANSLCFFFLFSFLSSIVLRACGFSFWVVLRNDKISVNRPRITRKHLSKASSSRADFIIQPGWQMLNDWIRLELS